jgi:fructose-1,6-bisphosphatase I
MNKLYTIERHILDQERKHPGATGELTALLYDMALAGKIIAEATTRAGLGDVMGSTSSTNSYGETQKKLDVFADETIFKMNDHTRRLCAMASEEHEDIIDIPTHFGAGKYVLLFDPLDGSSNIDVNVSVGTIFAIHRKVTKGERGTLEDVLQVGNSLVAAGYMIYGPTTIMVYTTGQGVHGFTLDRSIGEFILTHPDIRIPEPPKYYSANQGQEKYWTHGVRRYVRWLQGIDGEGHEPLSHRYTGSMVADMHRNILEGGVFFYAGDMRVPEKPYGKLRLMFEAQAMAFIARNAGGYASDGLGDILDIQPHHLHQRVPIFIGNCAAVEMAEGFIQQHDHDWIRAYREFRDRKPVFG